MTIPRTYPRCSTHVRTMCVRAMSGPAFMPVCLDSEIGVPCLLPLNASPRVSVGGDGIEDGTDNRYPDRDAGLLPRAFLRPSVATVGGAAGPEPDITVKVDSRYERVSVGVRSDSRRGGRRNAG